MAQIGAMGKRPRAVGNRTYGGSAQLPGCAVAQTIVGDRRPRAVGNRTYSGLIRRCRKLLRGRTHRRLDAPDAPPQQQGAQRRQERSGRRTAGQPADPRQRNAEKRQPQVE
jgi:hypothetical protein